MLVKKKKHNRKESSYKLLTLITLPEIKQQRNTMPVKKLNNTIE